MTFYSKCLDSKTSRLDFSYKCDSILTKFSLEYYIKTKLHYKIR